MNDLTDSQLRILDTLRSHPGSTARELAGHTGLAYSTITALLRGSLSEGGHVCRDGNAWSTNQTDEPADPDLLAGSSTSDSRADAGDPTFEPAPGPANTEHAHDQNAAATTSTPPTGHAPAVTQPDDAHPDARNPADDNGATTEQPTPGDGSAGREDGESGDPLPDGEQSTTAKRRYRKSGLAPLGKGGLQQHILNVLRATPDENWKITPLTRHLTGVVGKKVSAGAVVQACNKLAARGELIQTVDKPATFKAA